MEGTIHLISFLSLIELGFFSCSTTDIFTNQQKLQILTSWDWFRIEHNVLTHWTVGGKMREPNATGTSKLDWRSLESMLIDKNKVQIRTNWQKGTGTKKHENFRNFENFKEKKMSKFTSVLNLWPHNSWPGTLNHLAISLVNNRYKKIGKISENMLLIFGLAYLPLPLCWLRSACGRNTM